MAAGSAARSRPERNSREIEAKAWQNGKFVALAMQFGNSGTKAPEIRSEMEQMTLRQCSLVFWRFQRARPGLSLLSQCDCKAKRQCRQHEHGEADRQIHSDSLPLCEGQCRKARKVPAAQVSLNSTS